MERRKFWLLGVSVWGGFACESEEDRAVALVAELAQALPLRSESAPQRQARIRSDVAPALDAEFELVAPWLGPPNDRNFALTAATEIDRMFPLRSVELTDSEARLSKSQQRAEVQGTARVSGAQPGDLHGFDLRFDVDLKRDGAVWRVVRLTLSDPKQSLPQARP
jgi:hypothetical protein